MADRYTKGKTVNVDVFEGHTLGLSIIHPYKLVKRHSIKLGKCYKMMNWEFSMPYFVFPVKLLRCTEYSGNFGL